MRQKNTIRAKLIRPVEHRHLRWLRKKMLWSLNQFADAFNHNGCKMSRSYAKKLLRPRKPFNISKPVAARYRELRMTVDGAGATPTQEHTITILAHWIVENGSEVLGMLRPKRCRGHRLLFIPNVPRRVYCTRGTIGECAKLWRLKHKVKIRKEKKRIGKSKSVRPRRNVLRVTRSHRHVDLQSRRDHRGRQPRARTSKTRASARRPRRKLKWS
jgi:hypothetical protein